jgi:DNA modification methylase
LERYLRADEIAIELSEGNEEKYLDLMNEMDTSRNALGTKNTFFKRLQEKENAKNIPSDFEYHSADAIIYLQSSSDMSQIEDGQVSVIVTSPPYYEMRDYKSGKEQLGHEESEDVFVERLVNHFDDCMRVLNDRGTMWVTLGDFVVNYSYRMVPEKFTIGMLNRGWILHDKIIWLKNNPVFNNAERALVAHEYIYVFKKKEFVNYNFDWLLERDIRDNRFVIGIRGDKVKLRSIFDFRNGVLTTNVSNNARLREYCERAGIHLTHSATFPISIPTIAILTSSNEMDLVCDPFNGTATSGRSALLFNRIYRGFDVNPEYIKQSEIRLNMPTEEDLEFVNIEEIENLVQIENKKIFDNMMNPFGLQIKSKKTEKVSQELILNNLIKDGFTVISSFPL